MSMSTHIVGIKPPDEEWKKMKAVWDACKAAGISPPADVSKFFGHETPDEKGVTVSMRPPNSMRDKDSRQPEIVAAVTRYKADMEDGFEVDVTKLPKDIKIIRFFNSW